MDDRAKCRWTPEEINASMQERSGSCATTTRGVVALCSAVLAAVIVVAGCGDQVRQPSADELIEFAAAVPAGPSVDMDRVTRAMILKGPYRVVPGDTLQLEMLSLLDPQSLRDVAAANVQAFKYRVDDHGAIMLPIVGPFPVAGKSLSEIEANVIAAYFPKYVRMPFPVHAAVLEYAVRRVSIVGAVAKPGLYSLRHDEMSLVSLLMQAGGINEKGAAVIRINHAGSSAGWNSGAPGAGIRTAYAGGVQGRPVAQRLAARTTDQPAERNEPATLVLPVRGLNIPFADVALEEGDSVVVEWPQEQFVSVVGLVNRPGNFPYPPTARYTLIHAIGFAGGLDLVADPRYVSVYRLQSDGGIASVTVQLVDPKADKDLADALALPLSPGDIVSVEHTPRTRANTFFERIFRVNLGLYFNPDDVWRDD